MSLQGKVPLTGHPKTLRDLTHVTEVLTLPSAFGAIQLGETFSSCLSVNNEAPVDIEGVTLRVEMQTATSKMILAEYGGSDFRILSGDTMENVVHHEIKELGQHVLACTVTYRLPPGYRATQHAPEGQDPALQSFRKFYKFAVGVTFSVDRELSSHFTVSTAHHVYAIGDKSTIREDESACPTFSDSFIIAYRTRESFS